MVWSLGKTSPYSYLVNVSDARVPGFWLAVLVQRLDHLPAPLPVLGVLGQPPHQEVGLHSLGPKEVISRALFAGFGLETFTETYYLRTQLGVGPVVTLVTGFGDTLGQLKPSVAASSSHRSLLLLFSSATARPNMPPAKQARWSILWSRLPLFISAAAM